MSPKISVIIPAFNAEMFIADAIRSVLAQEYSSKTEIIVIDDNSSDNTKEIVRELSNNYSQIILLSNERTKGPSGARNTGLLKATGDYIAFLDADDLWLPNHLKEGIDFFDKYKNVDVVFYNFKIRDYDTRRQLGDWFSKRSFWKDIKVKPLDDNYYLIKDNIFSALLNESFIHLQSMIIRKKVVTENLFDERINHSEDRDFCIKLYLNSKATFAFKNIITGIYYRRSQSLTSNSTQNSLVTLLDHIKLFTEYLSLESVDNVTSLKIKQILLGKYILVSSCYRKLHYNKLAFSYLLKSFKYGVTPSQLKEFAKIPPSIIMYNILSQIKHST